ncbi:MAG TPA: oxygenase MpaB family protein [Solirubrobacteraceae bacterium]
MHTESPDRFHALDDDQARALLVGPNSITWRYASDARLYLVMLYPLLLQVAHPTVGAGVRDYSDFDRRPWNRLLRTLDYVYLLVYGGERAIAAGRRLRNLHKGFTGTREDGRRYYALEPGAYAWVHATLLHSYVGGHRQFGRPMGPDQVERFYREYSSLGQLIGVRPGELPGTWREFETYFEDTSQTVLEPNQTLHRVLRSVQMSPPPLPLPTILWDAVRVPARRALWLGGVGLLAPELRRRLEIPWSDADQRALDRLGRLSRALTPVLPARLRIMGPGSLRVRQRAIARGPLGQSSGDRRALAGAERAA